MILLEQYELLKAHGDHSISVGFGSYGQVKLAVDKKTGKNVAVKIVHKLAKNQVIFHQQLYHQNIIQLLGHYIDKQREITYMILEYADGGTLFEKVRNQTLNKNEVKSYFKDVCEAVSYLHQNQIMHRDIKPENILLTGKGHAKLCDFGFAAILGQRKTLCGTYQYMSPQMIQNKPYDYKIDIWALGILLFELIAGRAPFKGNSPQQVLDQMKTKIFFSQRFTTQEIDLIKSILRVTPSKRPTIDQILQHPYFKQQDTASTKDSEAPMKQQLKEQKSNFLIKNRADNTYNPNNMAKPQQNSYPFYIPKHVQQLHQPVIQGINLDKSSSSKQPITRPISNMVYVPLTPHFQGKQLGFSNIGAPNLGNFNNASFSNIQPPHFRKS